ncbi:DNA/RNA polymerases superfamily protein [Rhynchospora pubera]|uniref:DNA/RNA polymerases superfamily protein n=1 Tax=Rhynchospora pubera TaxID=906938 RepID=A0AAV8FGB1_9POAL|nr:DNA/RNA polymerases superfamily protein [Rhynchospora pubera]
MFEQLQSLVQGQRSVEEYTLEFYRLTARNRLNENEDHRIARYLHGLRSTIRDSLVAQTISSLSEAQSKAKGIEDQHTRSKQYVSRGNSSLNPTKSQITFGSSSTHNLPIQTRNPTPQIQNRNASFPKPTLQNNLEPNTRKLNIRCHRCHELGHYMNECPKARQLLVEDVFENEDVYGDYSFTGEDEEINPEDVEGESLISRRLCLAPPTKEDWKRHAIFKTNCTIGGKKCKLLIDSGNWENIISKEVVAKLNLTTTPHPHPYRLGWVNRGSEIQVDKRCQVQFAIGPNYSTTIRADVVPMDASHLILGRPW